MGTQVSNISNIQCNKDNDELEIFSSNSVKKVSYIDDQMSHRLTDVNEKYQLVHQNIPYQLNQNQEFKINLEELKQLNVLYENSLLKQENNKKEIDKDQEDLHIQSQIGNYCCKIFNIKKALKKQGYDTPQYEQENDSISKVKVDNKLKNNSQTKQSKKYNIKLIKKIFDLSEGQKILIDKISKKSLLSNLIRRGKYIDQEFGSSI